MNNYLRVRWILSALFICLMLVPIASQAADSSIVNLTELSAAPASDDWAVVVDISDTSMAATGTNKKITVANFLAALSAGYAMDLTSLQIIFDPTEITDVTWGVNTDTSHLWTWDTGTGTDPTMTVTDNDFTFNKTVKAAGFEATGTDHYLNVGNSSDYSTTTEGDTWFNTTDHFLRYYGDSATRTVVSTDQTQTLEHKTLTSPVINSAVVTLNTVGSFSSPVTTNPYSLSSDNAKGGVLFYGATGEIDLPAVADGMNVVIYNTGAFTITIDPNGTEVIVRDGTAQTGGVSMTLDSGAGHYVCLISDGSKWITLGYSGTLAEGS